MDETLHTGTVEPLDGNALVEVARQKGWGVAPPMFYGEGTNERGMVLMIANERISRSRMCALRDSMPEPETPRDGLTVEGVGKHFHRGKRPLIRFTGTIAALNEVVSRLPETVQL